jgi:cobalt-zinc-cadmium efflux system outer membrane protein
MHRLVFWAALAIVITPAAAVAQSITLTEADALARLSAASPRVRAIRASIELARADVLAASRWPNPRVTFDRESVAGVTEEMTMVAQVMPITGRRGLDIQAASALVDASSNRVDDAVRRARADLRLAFGQLLVAQRREREFAAAHTQLQELVDVLGKREAAGDTAGFDRLRAEREVLDLDADRANAATERARAQAAVAAFFSEAADPARIVGVDRAKSPASLPPVDALVEHAESKRGELLALRKEVDAARFAGRAADRRGVPEPEVVAGTKSSSAAGGDLGAVVAVHASIPFFDRSRAEKALAAARAARAEAQVDAFRLQLRTEIAALRAAVLERRETAARYRTGAVNSASEIERIAQVSYDAGERGILELLDAYRTGASARIRQAALDAAVRQAEIELEFVSGWEIE